MSLTCDICLLNPEGTMSYLHCLNSEPGTGCKDCKQRCGKPAVYIGGMNICAERHLQALRNRVLEPVEGKSRGDAEEELAQELHNIEETFKHL